MSPRDCTLVTYWTQYLVLPFVLAIIHASAKSRDLLGNGGAGGEACLPGSGVSPLFLFSRKGLVMMHMGERTVNCVQHQAS